VHGDLKPENVLVLNKGDVAPKIKLIDFGCSAGEKYGVVGHFVYSQDVFIPPEVRKTKNFYFFRTCLLHSVHCQMYRGEVTGAPPKSVDIYRLGTTLWVMLFKQLIYTMDARYLAQYPQYKEHAHKVRSEGDYLKFHKPSRWSVISPECHDLLVSLLSPDPNQRPTCSEVLQHPWLLS
jgi:serine/threonine protein kinase